jgi:hypothetical protein
VKRGEIAQARMAALARDIESSVLGVNYRGLVKTVNVKFLDAMKRVDDETMAHKNLLVKKIAALQSCGRSDALPLPRLRSAPIVTAAQYFAAPDA